MLKPGQATMDRDYYKDVTTEKPEGKNVVTNYGRFQSIYEQNHNEVVKKGDYVVPAKGQNNMRKFAFFV